MFHVAYGKGKKASSRSQLFRVIFFIKRSEIPSFKYISVEFLQGRVSNEVSTTFSYYINTLKSVLTAFFFCIAALEISVYAEITFTSTKLLCIYGYTCIRTETTC